MNAAITGAPTGTTMILRALARFPERTAFAWDGGSLTYRATLELIGRLQAAIRAQAGRVRRHPATHRRRQGRQEGLAREVLGGASATGGMNSSLGARHASGAIFFGLNTKMRHWSGALPARH